MSQRNLKPAVFRLHNSWAVYFLDIYGVNLKPVVRGFAEWSDAMEFALDSVIECAEGSIDSAVFRYFAIERSSTLYGRQKRAGNSEVV